MTNLHPAYLQMMNLHIDEMVLFRNLMKIGTDKNKAIYSSCQVDKPLLTDLD